MLIQPGVDASPGSTADFVELVKVNSRRRIDVTILDAEGEPASISEATLPDGSPDGELDLSLTTLGEREIVAETYWPSAVPSMRRIKNPTTGHYYLTLGEEANETRTTGTFVANWHARTSATAEDIYKVQVILVVSSRVLSLLPTLRMILDKSLKVVDPSAFCFLGWTESQLILALRSALHFINVAQPTVLWPTLDSFPIETSSEILIRTAVYIALESQMIFALDTDTQGYSVNGHQYNLLHQAPLAAYLGQLRAEITERIFKFKLQHVRSGTAKVVFRPDMAFAALLSASPYGATYRGMYTAL